MDPGFLTWVLVLSSRLRILRHEEVLPGSRRYLALGVYGASACAPCIESQTHPWMVPSGCFNIYILYAAPLAGVKEVEYTENLARVYTRLVFAISPTYRCQCIVLLQAIYPRS